MLRGCWEHGGASGLGLGVQLEPAKQQVTTVHWQEMPSRPERVSAVSLPGWLSGH